VLMSCMKVVWERRIRIMTWPLLVAPAEARLTDGLSGGREGWLYP
jgi:hypothetical protein